MIVGLLCLMIPNVVGRCKPLEILKGFDFLMPKYYWEGSDIEEVYEKIYMKDQFHKYFVKASDESLTWQKI